MRNRIIPPAIGLVALLAAVPATAQQMSAADAPTFVPVADTSLDWNPLTPPGFDEGMELAVIRGDPGVTDEPYVLRLSFPDGYRFPPHYHPKAENLTVLEGELLLAMGEQADESQLATYRPGDYLYIAGGHPHFGGATGRTVIQLHGTGPFTVTVVGSPQDDR